MKKYLKHINIAFAIVSTTLFAMCTHLEPDAPSDSGEMENPCVSFPKEILSNYEEYEKTVSILGKYDFVESIDKICDEDTVVAYYVKFKHQEPTLVYCRQNSLDPVIVERIDDVESDIFVEIICYDQSVVRLPKFCGYDKIECKVPENLDICFSSPRDTEIIAFSISPAEASLNFILDSEECQISIPGSDNIQLCEVLRVFGDDGQYIPGEYMAYVASTGKSKQFSELSFLLFNGTNAKLLGKSGPIRFVMSPSFFDSIKDKLDAWLNDLCSKEMLGRKTGSVGDELAYNHIRDYLQSMGYAIETQTFNSTSGYELRNVVVTIPGEIDSTIVIGSHYDSAVLGSSTYYCPAANDNASGVVTNLAFLDSLRRCDVKSQYTIVSCFWDGEEVFDGNWTWGARHYVNNLNDKSLVSFYINLDSIGHPHKMFLRYFKYGQNLTAMSKIVGNGRFEYELIDMTPTGGGSSDYVTFANAGIPYLAFGDHNGDMCKDNSHSANDIVAAISIDRLYHHVENLLDCIQY